jgi:predicted lipoprotein
MKRIIVLIAIIILAVLAICNSVYFEKLDARKQRAIVKNFNPKELVDYFWKNELDKALKASIDLKTFDSLLLVNPKSLKDKYGKSVGITSTFSCLVYTTTKISKPAEDKLVVEFKGNKKYNLLLKYIFGNTARDATGYFKVSDFTNSVDFNAVSSELNAIIQKNVIATSIDSLISGRSLKFVGAVNVNSETVSEELDIVPLKMDIIL